jgi:hypothetical protein
VYQCKWLKLSILKRGFLRGLKGKHRYTGTKQKKIVVSMQKETAKGVPVEECKSNGTEH